MMTIDAVVHIRNHPELFLPNGRQTGLDLAMAIVSDVLISEESKVTALRHQGWWVVASEVDWIAPLIKASVDEYFSSITPFPEAGPNSMHSEVLLTAFAQHVLTIDDKNHCIIKGSIDRSDPIWAFLEEDPSCRSWKRVVAFRL
jgi:hypothetical protein